MADLKSQGRERSFSSTSRLFKASQQLVFLCLHLNVRSLSKSKRKLKSEYVHEGLRPRPKGLRQKIWSDFPFLSLHFQRN